MNREIGRTLAAAFFIALLIALIGNCAYAQSAFTVPNIAVTGGTITGLSSPLPVASGGTGAATSTGSGAVVLATSPTLTTPNIGAATGTSLNVTGALQINGVGVQSALTGTTASLGGSALVAGQCSAITVAVTNATTSMVAIASPTTYPGDGFDWVAYVSSAGTVTVKVCGFIAGTPVASTYNVRVIQ